MRIWVRTEGESEEDFLLRKIICEAMELRNMVDRETYGKIAFLIHDCLKFNLINRVLLNCNISELITALKNMERDEFENWLYEKIEEVVE